MQSKPPRRQRRPAAPASEPRYKHTIPSRDEILAALDKAPGPLSLETLGGKVGIHTEQHLHALEQRLKAMVRDGQLLRNRLRLAEDHLAINLHETTMVPRLHDLGIQQPWGRYAQWCGIAASIPLAWRLMPHAIGMQQRPPILG